MATNLSVKTGEIGLFTFSSPWHSETDCNVARLILKVSFACKHLVNFGPVPPEFKWVKSVHPSSISSMATFALLLNLAGISRPTEFSVAISTQFCFTYTLEGVTAMPRGLHAIALPRISSFKTTILKITL